jgi:hypothetical protein
MSRLPIPFRRRRQTPLERAIDLGAKALKLYAASRVAKKGAKLPLIGVALGGAALAAKKLRGSKGPEPQAYEPPPTPSVPTPPKPDPGIRESPHGDVAADLLKGDPREAAAGGRNVGTPSESAGEPQSSGGPSTIGEAGAAGGEGPSSGGPSAGEDARGATNAPPAGVAGRADGADVGEQQAKDAS